MRRTATTSLCYARVSGSGRPKAVVRSRCKQPQDFLAMLEMATPGKACPSRNRIGSSTVGDRPAQQPSRRSAARSASPSGRWASPAAGGNMSSQFLVLHCPPPPTSAERRQKSLLLRIRRAFGSGSSSLAPIRFPSTRFLDQRTPSGNSSPAYHPSRRNPEESCTVVASADAARSRSLYSYVHLAPLRL